MLFFAYSRLGAYMYSRKTLSLAFAAATAITLVGMPAMATPTTASPSPSVSLPSLKDAPKLPVKPSKPADPTHKDDDKGDGDNGDHKGDKGDGGHNGTKGHRPKEVDHDVVTKLHGVPGHFVAGDEEEFDVTYINNGDHDFPYSELNLGVFADKDSTHGVHDNDFFTLKYAYGDGKWRTADNCWSQNNHEYTVTECELKAHHPVPLDAGGKVTVHVKLKFDDGVKSPDAGFYAVPSMVWDKGSPDSARGEGAHNVFNVCAHGEQPPTSQPTAFPSDNPTPTTAPTDQAGATNGSQVSDATASTQAVSAGLAHTGADATLPIAIGAGAVVVAGGGLLFFARRRRGGSHV